MHERRLWKYALGTKETYITFAGRFTCVLQSKTATYETALVYKVPFQSSPATTFVQKTN